VRQTHLASILVNFLTNVNNSSFNFIELIFCAAIDIVKEEYVSWNCEVRVDVELFTFIDCVDDAILFSSDKA